MGKAQDLGLWQHWCQHLEISSGSSLLLSLPIAGIMSCVEAQLHVAGVLCLPIRRKTAQATQLAKTQSAPGRAPQAAKSTDLGLSDHGHNKRRP